jgi:hypothetical protein
MLTTIALSYKKLIEKIQYFEGGIVRAIKLFSVALSPSINSRKALSKCDCRASAWITVGQDSHLRRGYL